MSETHFVRKGSKILWEGGEVENFPSINAAKRRSRELQKQGKKFGKEVK